MLMMVVEHDGSKFIDIISKWLLAAANFNKVILQISLLKIRNGAFSSRMIGFLKLKIGFRSSMSNDPFSQYGMCLKLPVKLGSSSGIGFELVYG